MLAMIMRPLSTPMDRLLLQLGTPLETLLKLLKHLILHLLHPTFFQRFLSNRFIELDGSDSFMDVVYRLAIAHL